MNYQEIKDLLNAGFTKDEIIQLTTSGNTPILPDAPEAAAEAEAAAEDISPVAGEETTSEDVSSPQQDDALEDIKKQLQQMANDNLELRRLIQSNNIRDRTVETVAPDVVADAEAALAALINPDFAKEGGL